MDSARLEPVTTSEACEVHTAHMPNSHVNDRHHVWPLGHGGPNIPENIITVCPTGHRNIHTLLERLLAYRGKIPYSELRTFSFQERKFAKLGFDRISRKAL